MVIVMLSFDLLHGDDVVVRMVIDESDGRIAGVSEPERMDLMPIGTVVDGSPHSDRLGSWWSSRSIPAARTGIGHLLGVLDMDDPRQLLPRSTALSLTDHYWIRPPESETRWEDVNFFTNGFSDDVGDLLFGSEVREGELDLSSPDNTSEGMLMKRWKIVDGRRCLIKTGELPYRQEVYNERAACVLAEHMGIPHVEYEVIEYEGVDCSICGDFIDEGTELVSTHQVVRSEIHEPGILLYDHLVSCCLHHGLDAVPFLDRMIVFDYLIGNTDRHLNNFGVVRDSRTLEWMGFALLFDNGTSMGCDLEADDIVSEAGMDCKPFSEYFPRQMALVRDTDWIDMDAVREGFRLASDVFSGVSRYRTGGRDVAVREFLESRADTLERWISDRGTESP